jgi:predicted amidohydrolase
MSPYRIALANLRYPASPEESITLATASIAEAARQHAAIICFPECFIPGYSVGGKPTPPPTPEFLDRAHAAVANAAAKANITTILGTERYINSARYITALVINNDGSIAGWQDKVQLDHEETPYTPASERHIFQSGPLTFGVVICHEGWRYLRPSAGMHAKEPKSSFIPTSIGLTPAALCHNSLQTPQTHSMKKPCSAEPPRTPSISPL